MVNKLETLLNQGVVNFTFKKANGEIRTARGTRNYDVLIKELEEKRSEVYSM